MLGLRSVDKCVLYPLLNVKEREEFREKEERGLTSKDINFYNYLINYRSSKEFKKFQEKEAELDRKFEEFCLSLRTSVQN